MAGKVQLPCRTHHEKRRALPVVRGVLHDLWSKNVRCSRPG
jgi:hypothetical protein